MKALIDNIKNLDKSQLTELLENFTDEDLIYAQKKARKLTDEIFGKKVFVRGLIEFSNYCKNDCLYCGIRCSNKNIERYRLSEEEILECCKKGNELGIKTFVLQSGEDLSYTDEKICSLISKIKSLYPDCAVTLSIGEKSLETYRKYKHAGADRYLLRHETINRHHYEKLHPSKMSYENRLQCLKNLQQLGFQTGCGIMTESPYQTKENVAEDLLFMKSFNPHMAGIGPFIPQNDTPFADFSEGTARFTLFILSLVRLFLPQVLLPSTTALNTIAENGRILGLNSGANVIMPNLTQFNYRKNYLLYNNKQNVQNDEANQLSSIKTELESNGYEMCLERGDYKNQFQQKEN